MKRSKNTIAIPPGATIKEQLLEREMKQKEFAVRMGMSEKHISKLINGEVQLTMDVAIRLEMVLGLSAQFWCNLESIYREKLVKINEEKAMDTDIEIARKLPYKQMENIGWIQKTKDWKERVYNLRKFFEVAHLEYLTNSMLSLVSFRKLSQLDKCDYALMAWTQKAKIEAREKEVDSINVNKLIEFLPDIRKMTIKAPEEFCFELIDVLAKCGIAIIFLPHIGGSFLHGATFLDNKKIVLGLTVRGKYADKFWFSLFHELGHIVNGDVFSLDKTTVDNENKADEWAKDILIPKDRFDEFIKDDQFSRESIITFSKELGIDPGILVGSLQKENYIKYSWYNDLKTKYMIR